MNDEYISGHPGISTSTVRLLRDDRLKYVRAGERAAEIERNITPEKYPNVEVEVIHNNDKRIK